MKLFRPEEIAEGMMKLVEDETLNGAALVVINDEHQLIKLPTKEVDLSYDLI